MIWRASDFAEFNAGVERARAAYAETPNACVAQTCNHCRNRKHRRCTGRAGADRDECACHLDEHRSDT